MIPIIFIQLIWTPRSFLGAKSDFLFWLRLHTSRISFVHLSKYWRPGMWTCVNAKEPVLFKIGVIPFRRTFTRWIKSARLVSRAQRSSRFPRCNNSRRRSSRCPPLKKSFAKRCKYWFALRFPSQVLAQAWNRTVFILLRTHRFGSSICAETAGQHLFLDVAQVLAFGSDVLGCAGASQGTRYNCDFILQFWVDVLQSSRCARLPSSWQFTRSFFPRGSMCNVEGICSLLLGKLCSASVTYKYAAITIKND